MKAISQFFRILKINYVLAKNGFDKVILSFGVLRFFGFLVYLNPWNWLRVKKLTRGEVLRKSFEELGPIFVKFGQALSTRPDIFPPDIAQELSKLQDKVPPFASSIVVKTITKTFKKPLADVFAEFSEQPLASASIAQVHAAKLLTGEDVVVKVLRPNIAKIIKKDLQILKTFARLVEKSLKESKRFKPVQIVNEFEKNLLHELDLNREAANASQLRRNFLNSELLYVPEIYWDYVTENIMVMERIYGIPVADFKTLRKNKVNMKRLAERGLEIFFTQVFRDNFFHADMHPGNIFVAKDNPDYPQYISIDFGIIGTLNDNDKRYLAENLLAFFNRDYKKIAILHIESGWVSKNTRVDEFESAIRTVCEPIFEKPLREISFALVVLRLFQVARSFEMDIQPQLVLLQKTLLATEGLGRQIDPDLNLWLTAKPYLEKWVRKQMGVKSFLKHMKDNVPFFVEQMPYMPRLVHDALVNFQQMNQNSNAKLTAEVKPKRRGVWLTGLISGLFISSATIVTAQHLAWLDAKQLTTILLGMAIGSGVVLLLTTRST